MQEKISNERWLQIFGKPFLTRMLCFLTNNQLSGDQFSCRKGKSTICSSVSWQYGCWEEGQAPTFSVFLDLSKTFIKIKTKFDFVDHNTLLDELGFHGIQGVSSTWFSSFLSQRTQVVRINSQVQFKWVMRSPKAPVSVQFFS